MHTYTRTHTQYTSTKKKRAYNVYLHTKNEFILCLHSYMNIQYNNKHTHRQDRQLTPINKICIVKYLDRFLIAWLYKNCSTSFKTVRWCMNNNKFVYMRVYTGVCACTWVCVSVRGQIRMNIFNGNWRWIFY